MIKWGGGGEGVVEVMGVGRGKEKGKTREQAMRKLSRRTRVGRDDKGSLTGQDVESEVGSRGERVSWCIRLDGRKR